MAQYQQVQPQGPPQPPGPAQPPTSDGATLQAYEVQFLGGILGPILETVGPPALRWLQERVRSMGASAASEAQVAAEAQEFQAQFLQFLAPLIPSIIDLGGRLLTRAIGGQSADAGGQVAGAGGGGYAA